MDSYNYSIRLNGGTWFPANMYVLQKPGYVKSLNFQWLLRGGGDGFHKVSFWY